MATRSFDDRLELLGTVIGVLVVLGSLGSLLGRPWETNPDTLAVVAQLLGIGLAVGVGVALVWIARAD